MNWYITVLKKYAVFTGRARRKEYWLFALFNLLFTIVAGILDNILDLTVGIAPYGFLYYAYSIAVLVPSLAVLVRRLHDTGRSGWWFFIVLIPLLGAIALLVFLCLDSQEGENKWGPNPKSETGSFNSEALDGHLTT